ncbi:MAG: hypothetical protein RL274_1204 [Pseudomonadota bacterium]|jgi:hypothetical protein
MKNRYWVALGAVAACGFAAPALTQDTNVDPAELQRIMAEHPAWAAWLADPALAKLALAGPKMPNSNWRVADIRRPQPPRVETGKACAAPPPGDAEVLFDGRDLSKWTSDRMDQWTLKNGEVTAGGKVYNFLRTKASYGDVQIHLEWKTPPQANPPVNPQRRGNSGVFPMGLYELQILDSHGADTYPDGAAGSIYSQSPPLANATRPPGVWQCYDIVFRAPRFEGEKVVSPARITALLNGVLVQDDTVLIGATIHGKVAQYAPHAAELPLAIQDHGNIESLVAFRNIWVRRLSSR